MSDELTAHEVRAIEGSATALFVVAVASASYWPLVAGPHDQLKIGYWVWLASMVLMARLAWRDAARWRPE